MDALLQIADVLVVNYALHYEGDVRSNPFAFCSLCKASLAPLLSPGHACMLLSTVQSRASPAHNFNSNRIVSVTPAVGARLVFPVASSHMQHGTSPMRFNDYKGKMREMFEQVEEFAKTPGKARLDFRPAAICSATLRPSTARAAAADSYRPPSQPPPARATHSCTHCSMYAGVCLPRDRYGA